MLLASLATAETTESGQNPANSLVQNIYFGLWMAELSILAVH